MDKELAAKKRHAEIGTQQVVMKNIKLAEELEIATLEVEKAMTERIAEMEMEMARAEGSQPRKHKFAKLLASTHPQNSFRKGTFLT